MRKFTYEMPETMQQAQRLGEEPRTAYVGGGTDILGALKEDILPTPPTTLINLKGVPGMKGIEKKADGLHIGALTTLTDIAESPEVAQGWAALADAAYSVATPNLRTTATVGGNICQDIRCWYYRYPDVLGGKINCARKEGFLCSAMMGENRYHSIFGAAKVTPSACTNECPGSTDIPAYMAKMRAGDIDGAARIILEVNPMPAITSRVCAHFCMEKCVREEYDEALNVGSVERHVGDYILEHASEYMVAPKSENGKSVSIVGSGPAGLAAAYYLRQAGYAVTLYEKQKEAGGCLSYAIPPYRLPKEIVQKFLNSLTDMGIVIKTETNVGKDITIDELAKSSDSVMLDTGTWQRPLIGLAGEELTRFGLEFLIDVNNYIMERPGQNMIVVGGGNVAMDVAITAKRLGCPKVTMVCLEQRDSMPANQEEIDRALEEDIEILNGWGPKTVLHKDGRVSGMTFRHCPRVLDDTGRFNPVYEDDNTMDLDSDIIIMAIGQKADLEFLEGQYTVEVERGRIKAASDYRTSVEGIFAAGDVTTGPATVIKAIDAGRKTAIGINKYLGGGALPVEQITKARKPEALLHFADQCHDCRERKNPELLPKDQRDMLKEDVGSLSGEEISEEIRRCFNCGCLAVNPSDMANMLYAMDARIVTNQRTLSSAEFFAAHTDIKKHVLGMGEFVTEIVVPNLPKNAVARYDKYRVRKSIDFAVLAVASVYAVEDGVVKDASIVLGAVAPIPLKREEAESYLIGKKLDEAVATQAAELALKGSLALERNEYKIDMAKVMVRRSLGF